MGFNSWFKGLIDKFVIKLHFIFIYLYSAYKVCLKAKIPYIKVANLWTPRTQIPPPPLHLFLYEK